MLSDLFYRLKISKIVSITLGIQALIGTYQSIKFIFFEYPQLELQLSQHLITQDQLNNFASKAIIIVFTTLLSAFFALRISIVRSELAQKINTLIGIVMIFANTFINNYLNRIGSAQIITQLFFSILNKIKSFVQ